MANIGLEFDRDDLVLKRGRDFKWAFDYTDETGAPANYPPGDLYLELYTGGEHNAVQDIEIKYAAGGEYRLGVNGTFSDLIEFDTLTQRPHLDQDSVKGFLEDIPGVGDGNVLVSPAILTPTWQLGITLNPAHNEIQRIKINNANSGQYKLGYGNKITGLITFGGTAADMQAKLEALSTIGTGNVLVTKVSDREYLVEFINAMANTDVKKLQAYAYGWGWGLTWGPASSVTVSTVVDGLAQLTETLVEVLSDAINRVYDSFENLYGVQLDFNVVDTTHALVTATSIKTYTESRSKLFKETVTGEAIKNAVANIAELGDILSVVDVKFWWDRRFTVEFVGALANTPMPAITVDATTLTGPVDPPEINVVVTAPGHGKTTKWPFAISGSTASIKVESEVVDTIANRTEWDLVWKPQGEPAGGDPVARGVVRYQR